MSTEIVIEIGQEYNIKKCDISWIGIKIIYFILMNYYPEEGCLFLHIYAPLYIEKELAPKIEIAEIDDLHYPKSEIEENEMDSNVMETDEK